MDLQRRLVPKTVAQFEAARDLAQRRRQNAADLTNVIEAVGRRFGIPPQPGARTVPVGAFARPLFATAQVLQPLWRDERCAVRFSTDADPDHAFVLAALVGTRGAGPR